MDYLITSNLNLTICLFNRFIAANYFSFIYLKKVGISPIAASDFFDSKLNVGLFLDSLLGNPFWVPMHHFCKY